MYVKSLRTRSPNHLDHLLASCAAHIDIVEEKDGSFGSTTMKSFSGFASIVTPMKGSGQYGGAVAGTPAGIAASSHVPSGPAQSAMSA